MANSLTPENIPAALAQFDQLPDSAHVRLPIVAALRGTSPATVWRHVKAGLIPQPVRLGPNTTAWNVGALRASMKAAAAPVADEGKAKDFMGGISPTGRIL